MDEQIAARKRRDELVNCDCQEVRIVVHFVDSPVKEETGGVRPCPVHGFDRLEDVIRVGFVNPNRDLTGQQLNGIDQTSEHRT